MRAPESKQHLKQSYFVKEREMSLHFVPSKCHITAGNIHPSSTQTLRTGTHLSQILWWNQEKEKFCSKLLSGVRTKRKTEYESKLEREQCSAHFGFKFCLSALAAQLGFHHPAWQLCSFSAVWHEPASFLLWWCCAICMLPCIRALGKKEKCVKEAIRFWNPLLLQLGSVLSWDAQHCSSFHNKMIRGPLKFSRL